MHGVVVQVSINDQDDATRMLHEQVVPMTKESAGFVNGYWLREGNSGLSVLIYESEDAARAVVEQMRSQGPPGDAVTLDSVEMREVVANA